MKPVAVFSTHRSFAMKRLADQIKQALSALAKADEGEISGRYRMEAALNTSAIASSPAPSHSRPRLIALGVGATLPDTVLDYVVGVCRRMQANLLLLTNDAEGVRALLAPHLPALQGITCETEALGSASRRAVLAVLGRRAEVLFAVSGTPDDPVRCLVDGRRGLLRRGTPVPVVVVGAASPPRKASRRKPEGKPVPARLSTHSLLQP